jgi:hypothetical protein
VLYRADEGKTKEYHTNDNAKWELMPESAVVLRIKELDR